MSGQRLIKIIDFKKDCLSVGFERAKIVFAIWVVGLAEIVVDRDGLDDSGDRLRADVR